MPDKPLTTPWSQILKAKESEGGNPGGAALGATTTSKPASTYPPLAGGDLPSYAKTSAKAGGANKTAGGGSSRPGDSLPSYAKAALLSTGGGGAADSSSKGAAAEGGDSRGTEANADKPAGAESQGEGGGAAAASEVRAVQVDISLTPCVEREWFPTY